MGLLTSLLGEPRRRLAITIDGVPPTDPAVADWFGGGRQSSAGAVVTDEKAMSLSAVFAAVNLLSRVYGSLPLSVYERQGKENNVAVNNNVHYLLNKRPNDWMTPSLAFRAMEQSRLLCGRACGEIQWDGAGNPAGIWPLEGYRVVPKIDQTTKELYYFVDGQRRVERDSMIFVPLVSADGVEGRSFLDYAIESLGLGISAQEFAARFFGNGAKPGGLLVHKGNPKPEARKEMREGWNRDHGTAKNSHKIGVLWGGWEFNRDAGSVVPEEAQLLETRKFTTEEVARWLNIPPHMLAELSRATFSNIEEMGINLVIYTLRPPCVEYEQEYNYKLLDNSATLYTKHDFDALLRGNRAARSAYYREMFMIGVFSINDILEMEDRNPVPGGEKRFVPANMVTLENAGNPPAAVPPPVKEAPAPPGLRLCDEDAELLRTIHAKLCAPAEDPTLKREMLLSTYNRLLRVETNAIRRAAKDPSTFIPQIEEFYTKHVERLSDALFPAVAAVRGANAETVRVVDLLTRRLAAESLETLVVLSGNVTAAGLANEVETQLLAWEATLGERFANHVLSGEKLS